MLKPSLIFPLPLELEPDGTEVELELGFRVSVLRKAKMQLFHK